MSQILFISALLLTVGAHGGEPYIPASDDVVLERSSPPSARILELRRLAATAKASPRALPAALDLARSQIQISRQTADPRYLGYAQATLAPWWNENNPPTEVLVLRAIIRQSRHDFAGALKDLDQALALDPNHPQAWLTRITVLQVMGRYEEAKRGCLHLVGHVDRLIAVACAASVSSMQGRLRPSYDLLAATLGPLARPASPESTWCLSILAELAARLEDFEAAQHAYDAALAADPDPQLLGAYSDFLLDQRRPQEVVELLKGQERIDPLLLRLALAEKQLDHPALEKHVALLTDRFHTATLRGDSVHRREEAIFKLHLLQSPAEAVALAAENWTVQKEIADARILLESALASGQARRAEPVRDWLEKNRIEAPRLRKIELHLVAGQP